MTRLLISVRNAGEAETAVAAGADLIDIKEPRRGALGAAESHIMRQVIRAVAGRLPVSAALGELLESRGKFPAGLARGLKFAKFGLAGCADWPYWHIYWRMRIAQLPPTVLPVAVAYADHRRARAPHPNHVLRLARSVGCRAILLDTFGKRRGSLTDFVSLDELRHFVAGARDGNMLSVVGGGLVARDAPLIASLDPDYLAVRGAVCTGGRAGRIDPRLVRQLAQIIRRD